AKWLKERLPKEVRLLSSPAARALETAEALGLPVKTVRALAPGASIDDILKAADWPDDAGLVIVVGHQPDLGGAAAYLVSSANTSFQSAPSSPASCILPSLPRCASTRRARRACSMREKPGMSALEMTYAECLWYCACAIDSPSSASRAAQSSIARSASSS